MDRREFVQAGGAVAASMVAVGAGVHVADAETPETQRVKEGFIDAHSHIWGRNIDEFPLAKEIGRAHV